MDFLGNQTRMNFPEIKWGMDFLGNQTGVAKKMKNNNMIRLVPARIESRRVRFSRKSNEDEFPRKSNGGWIFLGIKWGLQKKIIIIIT